MRTPRTAGLGLVFSLTLNISPALAQAAANGWTIRANAAEATLTIEHAGLGTVLQAVHLNLKGEHGPVVLKNWTVQSKGANQLSIKTTGPRTAWVFDLGANALRISSTDLGAVLTGEAPASADRLPVRPLDPQGIPVTWRGTDEVVGSYGGSETRNPSFLPHQNAECMYFSLGKVSAANLHSLFDRKSDVLVGFSGQTRMQRAAANPDLMSVVMPVPGNTLIRLTPDYLTKTVGLPFYAPFDDSNFPKAPAVWSSWLSYYAAVTEQDMVRNTDWIAANLKPYGFDYVVLDDGYDRGKDGEHYWIEKWDQTRFPHGPQWLTGYIKSKGLHPGVWIVPNAYAGALEQHPEWYLRNKQGNTIPDYRTPSLDSSNPEVQAFLKHLFATLNGFGFEYYKFDGEHALPKYAPPVDKTKLFDRAGDPLDVYRKRMQLIRETVGPKTFLEGCPAGTPLNGIGYFDAYFNGADAYNSWKGMFAVFSSINGNAFLNHIATYLMPGEGMDLEPAMGLEEGKVKRPGLAERIARSDGPNAMSGVTPAEARTLVSYVSLTGVAYSLVSVMPELPADRVQLVKMTLPTMPIMPIDLFSRGTDAQYGLRGIEPDDYIHNYPEVLDLKVNAKSGIYDVVALTNWRAEAATKELSFAKQLGVEPGSYAAFDFWNQKLDGVFKEGMKVEIAPHDTRVFLIHPVTSRPELIGNSRHITGAYSVQDLGWDGAAKRLHGAVESIPGETYSLFVYVPTGMSLRAAHATAGTGELAIEKALAGNSLKISFPGQREPVKWEIEFAGAATPRR
jgi:hypothetical protein